MNTSIVSKPCGPLNLEFYKLTLSEHFFINKNGTLKLLNSIRMVIKYSLFLERIYRVLSTNLFYHPLLETNTSKNNNTLEMTYFCIIYNLCKELLLCSKLYL